MLFRKAHLFSFRKLSRFSFSTSKQVKKLEGMTFYDVLEIPPHSSMSEIKKAYIKKAKEWHPDQNSEKEEAAVITKAYETLKDPSKRQIYDLGSANPNFNDQATEEDYSRYYEREGNQKSKPYWQNKWHNYKKPEEENLRDHYDNFAQHKRMEAEWEWKSILIKLGAIATIFIGFDMLRYYKQQKHKELINIKKEILTSQYEDQSQEIKKGVTLNDYIQLRINQIEEEESGFEEVQ